MAFLTVERQDDTFVVKTPAGKWEVAHTWLNEKLFLIFLRLWQDDTGKAVYTFQEIAEAFGYADRRNVHNYWQEFVACEREFVAFLRRKRKVDDTVVAAVEAELRAHIWSSLSALCARTNQRLGRSDVTVPNIQAALEQIPCSVIRDVVVSGWEAGRFHPKEGVILEEVMVALETGALGQRERALECLAGVGILPSAENLEEAVQETQWEAAKALLTPDVPISSLSEHTRQMVFALNLYYWNVPLSRIGLWLGKGKSTIYGWVIGLAVALWTVMQGWIVSQVQAGHLYIDEKWLKIRGTWHYWFVAIDDASGLPVVAHLLPTRTTWACRWFLMQVKRLGKAPRTIITDGLAGYASGIAKVFAGTKHLLCLFHHQQGVTRWVKNHRSLEDPEANTVKKRMKRVVQTQDARTVRRRLTTLAAEDAKHGWGIASWIATTRKNLGRLIPALRRNRYPKTTNPIERFFRAFQRFYKTRGGFHSVQSAKRALLLFLVVYLFTQQAETGKAPIEQIVPAAARMPLYRLLNDPFACGMVSISHNNSELEELATTPLKKVA